MLFASLPRGAFTLGDHKQVDGDCKSLYFGIDPTGDFLHIGHISLMRNAIKFCKQNQIMLVVVIGGFTGNVGDPSDQSSSRTQVVTYTQTVTGIVEQILSQNNDISYKILNNDQWLSKVHLLELLDFAERFSLNRLVKVEFFRKRLAADNNVNVKEFLYFLLQAYDFAHLHKQYGCGVQMGGSDQAHNIISGIKACVGNAMGICLPLLTMKGDKISKTKSPHMLVHKWSRCVADNSFYSLFHSLVSIPDGDIDNWTDILGIDIPGDLQDPVKIKNKIAKDIVRFVYGEKGLRFVDWSTNPQGLAPEGFNIKSAQLTELKQLFKISGLFSSHNQINKMSKLGHVKLFVQTENGWQGIEADNAHIGSGVYKVVFGKKVSFVRNIAPSEQKQ